MTEEDWYVNVFGTELQGVPSPSTPMRRPRTIPAEPPLPAPGTPIPKLTSSPTTPRNTTRSTAPTTTSTADSDLKTPDVLALPDQQPGEEEFLRDSAYEPALQQPAQEIEELESKSHQELAPIRPNYNLRRVLQRIPILVEREELNKAKQLLLGLHERLWHSPASDFTNLLRKAGMSGEVIALAREAVQSCAICRKYVRLPARPQMRARGASIFNQTLQLDLFYWETHWFMLLIDEATRFKKCGPITGQTEEDLLQSLLDLWIYNFGPPENLILDQQVALMTQDVGGEFERLGINRSPRGTTAGKGAEQHTGTGIVERHVSLMKLTMYKIRAEMQRQGLTPTEAELGQEAAMAHNITLCYGGVTPSMAVFGTLPRGFYDPESKHIMNTDGAADSDLTIFERALRIRQTSLAQAQQAIAEDRVARAARTRPHQLDVQSLVAGTSEVEFYREVKKDPGWRGPALLLRLDNDEGVAVIQYQGKPYLVALRHIRPFRGIYHLEVQNHTVDEALRKLMVYVENMTEYKVYLYGWIMKRNSTWVKLPKNNHDATEVLGKASTVAKGLSHRELHGILFGRALRSMKPPAGTSGILLTWLHGSRNYAIQEHHSDGHLQIKKFSTYQREDLCVIYFFFYHQSMTEDGITTSRQPHPHSSTRKTETDQPMEEEPPCRKRDGPDSRTVVIAPEKKKQKMAYVQKDLEFLQQWYFASRPHMQVQLDFPAEWRGGYDLMTEAVRAFLLQRHDHKRSALQLLFTIPYKSDHQARACLRTARIFKVDEETNNIEDHDITPDMWPKVNEADDNEVKQFVDERAFKPIHEMQFTDSMVIIDAKWVRKWKRQPDRTLKVKSRLCARGCFDAQKGSLTTRSTTATRLSQRLLVSQAARKRKGKRRSLESWDIAGAFLKGLGFKEIQEALKKLGFHAPTRQVVVIPPMNVWRHLQKHSDLFKIPEHSLHRYGLLCLKPIYGLNDAPLAWQLCLHAFIMELGGTRSQLDENCFLWKEASSEMSLDNTLAMVTTHVDDLALTAPQEWLDEHYDRFVQKFKKVSRQKLPFDHCGCRYSATPSGYKIDQADFVDKMKAAPVPQRPDDSKLEPSEVSDFRSILGALLWITATRLDIVADVSVLQSRVTTATVKEIKLANEVLVKAQNYKEAALHYREFEADQYRLVCIHDASSANSGRHYAQEGILILLMSDAWHGTNIDNEVEYDVNTVKMHGGVGHLLHAHGGKAKRVSYSTSHAETLSMVNGLESTTLILIRVSEKMHQSVKPTLKELTTIQESGNPLLPCDYLMDCKDLWELSTGQKVLPQDKTQRLYILGIRESRITGKIRMIVLVPTESMVADALTKPMISPGLLMLLTTGKIEIFGKDGHPVLGRILPSLPDYDEQTLMKNDEEITQLAAEDPMNVKATHASILFGMIAVSSSKSMRTAMMLGMVTAANAQGTANHDPAPTYNYMGIFMHYTITFVIVIGAIILERNLNKLTNYPLVTNLIVRIKKKMFSDKVKVEIDDDDDPMDVDHSRLNALDRECQDLEDEIRELRDERRDLLEYQKTMERSRDYYKSEFEQAQENYTAAEAASTELRDELQNKETELSQRTAQLTAVREDLALMNQELAMKNVQAQERDARIDDLRAQLNRAPDSAALGPLGLHRADQRAARNALEAAENQITTSTFKKCYDCCNAA